MMANPFDYRREATLRNGVAVTIRHLRDSDRARVAKAVENLDRESIYRRLFTYRRELTQAGLDRIMHADPDREVVLVVTTGADETVIGGGRYVVADGGDGKRTAEVAFMVEEDYQGLGIAGRVLAGLAEIAREHGIDAFEAEVLSENKSMIAVFARSGLPMRQQRESGVIHITLGL